MSFTPSAAPGTGPGTREPANALRPREGGIPENDAGYRRLARHPASRCWCRVSHSLQSTPEPGLFESFGSGKQNALGSDEFMLGGASVSARFTSLPQTTFLLTGLPDAGLALRDWARTTSTPWSCSSLLSPKTKTRPLTTVSWYSRKAASHLPFRSPNGAARRSMLEAGLSSTSCGAAGINGEDQERTGAVSKAG